jgi:predicted O-methyltransferase YrrM
MSVTDYLIKNNVTGTEGYTQGCVPLSLDLINLTRSSNCIMEIGFNAGHSSELFLANNPKCVVVSFDIGHHDYVSIAKEYIDYVFPERHSLIIGDSLKTVPEFAWEKPFFVFDTIFIDGGHDYEVAKGDLENCFSLADGETLVIIDDVVYEDINVMNHTVGPCRAWREMVDKGVIIEEGHGEYCQGRGMSWGRYRK